MCSPGVKWVVAKRSFHLQKTETNVFVLSKERGAKATTNRASMQCVCARENKRERDQSRGGYVLNPCVGGEASPTQNALPPSLYHSPLRF